ncbi:hypothetical protein FRC06_008627 [Ceratobasidium sp. 370]|nr:hypothetical protein FRC06_008627 [Ceratobasidium sp. 370]
MAYPHVPFPVTVPLTSTLFHASPFTSNASSGWASSCNECNNSVWSTGAPDSTLSFSFWGSLSPTTYVSSGAGNTGAITYNGSTVLIFGPCNPTSGLLRVSIDGSDTITVNTSSPISSNNCLLYQSPGYSALALHTLSFTTEGDQPVGINHLEFFRVLEHSDGGDGVTPGAIVGGVIGGIVLIAVLIVAYSMRSRKTRQKINRAFTVLCS